MSWTTHPPGVAIEAVLTAAQMRAADAATIDDLGVPGAALMETAGRALATVCHALAPDASVLVCAGTGNNGGDGHVAARYLASWGHAVRVAIIGDADKIRGDAAVHLAALDSPRVPVEVVEGGLSTDFDVAIDALLGTGLSGAVRGPAAEAVAWLNLEFDGPIVAADIPSGICSDTGAVLGEAIAATATVTFGTSKFGHWCHPGAARRGALHVVDIGIPATLVDARARLLGDADLRIVTRRGADGHKGTFGHVGVVGGSVGKLGAARMAADAALKAGAGLVTIDAAPSAVEQLSGLVYEVMVAPFEWGAPRRSAFVVGPGLSADAETGTRLRRWLGEAQAPLVLDADGLNHFAGCLDGLRSANAVLTPHPGEAARLLGSTAAAVQADRPGAVRALVEATGCVTVLKGAHTLVGAPGGVIRICPAGNSGLGTGGSGDVLAGVIGALLARGVEPLEAASAGVLWHARAGDAAAARGTENTLIARDIIACLGEGEKTCSRG